MVTITFGEAPDPTLSSIKVFDQAGASVVSGPTATATGDPKRLTVPLRSLSAGFYTVAWRTVSAVDGHLATGSFAFAVGGAALPSMPPGMVMPAGTTAVGPSIVAIAGRWLLFIGLVLLVGVASLGSLVVVPAQVVARRLLPIAWGSAAIGTLVVTAVQLSDAGVDLGRIFGTSFGGTILARGVPLAIAAPFVGLAFHRRRVDRLVLLLVGLAAVLALLADVTASHAATGSLAVLDVPIQLFHVLAVGMWLGGLAGLLLTIRGMPGDATALAARRFSRVATVGIATVAASGLLRAISEVGTIESLLNTDFGRLVIAKSALFAGLAGLGAVNHFRNVPGAGRAATNLRRAGSVELLVAGTVLLLSATLVNLAPPSEVAAANPGATATPSPGPSAGPLVVTGNDFGTSVRVRLQVTPAAGGFPTFDAAVTDYDTGAPVPATGLTLRFALPARPDIGSSRLDLSPAGAGLFTGSGGNLSIDGTWQVTAVVVNGVSSVEVPLELTTRTLFPSAAPTPGPTIDVNAVAGLPTIYTVHLAAGRTVQVYADPGTAGPNELHATFFDRAGTELPIQAVTMALRNFAGVPILLTPRMLEPGHFVADTPLAADTYTLTISAPAPGGDRLATGLDIPITK